MRCRFFAALFLSLAACSAHGEQAWVDLISRGGAPGLSRLGLGVSWCGDVELKPGSQGLVATPGEGVVAALYQNPLIPSRNLYSKQEFGDCEVELEFLIAKGSNSGVKLQSRYEIQLYDSHDKAKPTARECGGVYPHWLFQGRGNPLKYIDQGVPPSVNAARPAGEWQTLRIVFHAPRFDDAGNKIKDARFVEVVLNDVTIHQDVVLDSPTGNASDPKPEVATAPLMLQTDHGAVAFRNVRVRPLDAE